MDKIIAHLLAMTFEGQPRTKCRGIRMRLTRDPMDDSTRRHVGPLARSLGPGPRAAQSSSAL
jgi:hypothetical protein